MRIVVIIFLILIVLSLGSALMFMIKDRGQSKRMRENRSRWRPVLRKLVALESRCARAACCKTTAGRESEEAPPFWWSAEPKSTGIRTKRLRGSVALPISICC